MTQIDPESLKDNHALPSLKAAWGASCYRGKLVAVCRHCDQQWRLDHWIDSCPLCFHSLSIGVNEVPE